MPLCLRGQDLRQTTLEGRDLREANLSRADLRGVDLSGNDLEGAKLLMARYDSLTIWPEGFAYRSSGAVGPGAQLSGKYLCTADLRGMDLRGARMLGVYLGGADLRGALLHGVSFVSGDLKRARFCGALMRGCRFRDAELDGCDFRGADLRDAELGEAASVVGAVFTGALGLQDWAPALLSRRPSELDHWNALARCSTRDSLEDRSKKDPLRFPSG